MLKALALPVDPQPEQLDRLEPQQVFEVPAPDYFSADLA